MRRRSTLLAFLLLPMLVSLLFAEPAALTFKDLEKQVKSALASDDPTVRARAFDRAHECPDLRTVKLIISSVVTVERAQAKIRKDQEEVEGKFEANFSKLEKLKVWFANSPRSPRDYDRYNGSAKKIAKKLDHLTLQLKNLENDFTRARALLDTAVQAMAQVLTKVEVSDLNQGLEVLQSEWRDGKSLRDKMRWLDTLANVERASILERVRDAVRSRDLPVEVRAAALQTLADKGDATAFDLGLEHLESFPRSRDMAAAGVVVMRLLHERRCIEPLIAFLGKEGLKRLREDAHEALKSLTGEKHGPYQEPWARWWEDNHQVFEMPHTAVAGGQAPAQGEGVTFYGVHTFSDRVLFILDVSGSMDKLDAGIENGPQLPRIDVARNQLLTALDGMNDGDTFNLIFFNHEVVPWQTKMMSVSDSTRRRARKWVVDQTPLGGTNIHDALEAGFGLALRATGEPIIDTIFFLTDGQPTAGKIQDPDQILAAVAEWNRAARVKLHAIGIGKHDQEFMEKLAKLGGGKYVAP